MHSPFPANAGKTRPTKRRSQIAQKPAVDPRNAHIHLLRHAMTTLQISGPDRRRQPVLRVVGHCYRFFFGIKRRDVAHWTKNFFLHATCRFRQPSIDGGLHIEALVATVAERWNTSSSYDRRPFFACNSEVGKNFFAM